MATSDEVERMLEQFEATAPALIARLGGLSNVELAMITLGLEGLVAIVKAETDKRGLSPAQVKATIDAGTQAAIAAKFGT